MPESLDVEIKHAIRRVSAELAARDKPCRSPWSRRAERGRAPAEAITSAASCGWPLSFIELRRGATVLDVGCGAGIDVFIASKLVGSRGRVIGVDMVPEMVFKARRIASQYRYRNVEFRLGEAELLPVHTESVDVVISNCVINMILKKLKALQEMIRVLKPGGELCISDLVATRAAEAGGRHASPEEWATDAAGAVTLTAYFNLLKEAGFGSVRCVEERFESALPSPRDASLAAVNWRALKG